MIRCLIFLAAFALAGAAAAQGYPSKPVRLVVPYPAGQGTDIAARYFAEQLSRALGQNYIIENRVGAAGAVGTESVAKSPADGYTLLMGASGTHAMNEHIYPSIGYDPEKDFEPITLTGMLPMVVSAHPSFAPSSVAELVQAAKAKPDGINVALPSPTARIVLELLKQAGAPLFPVTYKSSPTALTEVMGGQLPVVIDTVTATRPHVASGKLKAIAITSLKSSELMPGVRSVAEQGVPGFEVTAWNALFAPKGTPRPIVALLHEQMQKILAQAETRQRLLQLGFEPVGTTPEQLAAFVRSERDKWGRVIRAAGITAN
jgi:tripartite-type tricarboxylate transporter receptor subunit TctC